MNGINISEFIAFVYNTSIHETTKETPFFLATGRDAKNPIESISPNLIDIYKSGSGYKARLIKNLSKAFEIVKRIR